MAAPKGVPKGTRTKGNLSLDQAKRKMQNTALQQAVKAVTSTGHATRQVNLSDVLAECFRFFRGPAGFARRLYIQYLKAPSGSQTRTKILDILLKMTMAEASRSGLGSGGDTNDMSDEEIAEEEERIVRQGMEPDMGDPVGMGEALQVEDAAESAESEDPEIAELDREIAQMEEMEGSDETGGLGKLIYELGEEVEESYADDGDGEGGEST